MSGFNKINGSLCADQVPLTDIAKDYGTPAYVYSASLIKDNYSKYSSCIRREDKLCFSVKSNSNTHILEILAKIGSGFDVVSGGELKRSLLAGGDPKNIVFSGVGKSYQDIELALKNNIFSLNVESESELERVIEIAKKNGTKANCSIRVNPNISSDAHPYIDTGQQTSKFGLSKDICIGVVEKALDSGVINLIGLASHIGSQIFNKHLILQSLEKLIDIAKEITKKGQLIQYLNIGGGLGISYKEEQQIRPSDYLIEAIKKLESLDINLVLEPGRSIVGNAGMLLTRVEYLKETQTDNFAILDSGMNDLARPALYEAWHNISTIEENSSEPKKYILAGPVCESADILGSDRLLSLEENSILAIHDTGAYGYVMASNYNSRLRPPEILVEDCEVKLIRRRESFEDIIHQESNL